jgi:hypothetical protein
MSKSHITGTQAFAHLNVWRLNHKPVPIGRCHATCQNAWGLPVKYASALDAWNHVPKEHRHTDPSKAPIGAPHFWDDGYGHVALQSDKKGVVISTDAPNPGYIGERKIEWFAENWGKKYLGWASQYNDVDLQLTKMPS